MAIAADLFHAADAARETLHKRITPTDASRSPWHPPIPRARNGSLPTSSSRPRAADEPDSAQSTLPFEPPLRGMAQLAPKRSCPMTWCSFAGVVTAISG